MIKAILFDFDGTLINTNNLIFMSHNYAFQKLYGRDITKNEFLKLYGRPLIESLNEGYGEDDGAKLLKLYREFNETNHDKYVESFEGVEEGIKKLYKSGISLGIVTSKRKSTLMKGINFLKLEKYFNCLVTPADSTKYKPDPEPVLIGCEKLCAKPFESVYVGDSVFDLAAGKGAGTKTCAVGYSLTPLEELKALKPDFVVNSIEEFADMVLK